MNSPQQNHAYGHSRIRAKQRKAQATTEQAAQAAALQRTLANIDPAYLDKIRYDCLRSAHDRLRGASPEDVVREAARDLEGRLCFLAGGES